MNEPENTRTRELMPRPDPALRRLDRLVGTWSLTGRETGPEGEIHGQVAFEWMEGGFFLVQHVEIDYIGRKMRGIEYIGYDESGGILKSYFFGNEGNPFNPGNPLEYVYEVGDDTLTIWGGYVGSSAVFKGKFSQDGNTIRGRWEWPGGGYTATLTRIG